MPAVTAAQFVCHTGYGLPGIGLVGLHAGGGSFCVPALLYDTLRSPILRLLVGLVFAVPAALSASPERRLRHVSATRLHPTAGSGWGGRATFGLAPKRAAGLLRISGALHQKLVFKQSHHHIVVPGAIYKSRLSFPAFNDETAFFISADGALIISKHPDSDPMKPQFGKGVSQKQENSFSAQTFAKECRIENSDCHGGTSVMEIDIVQPDLTDKPAANLDDPGMGVVHEPFDPSHRAVSCQRTHIAPAHSEHLDYFCMIAQGKASLHVIGASSPELKIFPFQHGCHGFSRTIRKNLH